MSAVNAATPYVYMNSHVKADGSVSLIFGVAPAGKFAQVTEDCRALRANRPLVFPQFLERARNYHSLIIEPRYKMNGSLKTHLLLQNDPLKSPEMSAILTDEYERQLAQMDNPNPRLRFVKRIEIHGEVVYLVRMDEDLHSNHLYPESPNDEFCHAITTLRKVVDHRLATLKSIEWVISRLIARILHFNVAIEYVSPIFGRLTYVIQEDPYLLNGFFAGRLTRLTDNKIYTILNTRIVIQRVRGIPVKLLSTLCREETAPSPDKMREVFDCDKSTKFLNAAFANAGRDIRSLTLDMVIHRSYKHNPEAQRIKAPLVRLLEPAKVEWNWAKLTTDKMIGNALTGLSKMDRKDLLDDLYEGGYRGFQRLLRWARRENAPESDSTDKKDGKQAETP